MSFISQTNSFNNQRRIITSSSMPKLSLQRITQPGVNNKYLGQSNMSFKKIMPNKSYTNQIEIRNTSLNNTNTMKPLGQSYVIKNHRDTLNLDNQSKNNHNRCNTERSADFHLESTKSQIFPFQQQQNKITQNNKSNVFHDLQRHQTFGLQQTHQNVLNKIDLSTVKKNYNKQYIFEIQSQNSKLKQQNIKLKADNLMLKAQISGTSGITFPLDNVQTYEKRIKQLNQLLFTSRQQKNRIEVDLKMITFDLEEQRKAKHSLLDLIKNARQNDLKDLQNRIDYLQKYSSSLQKRNVKLIVADKQLADAQIQIKQMTNKIEQLMDTLRYMNDQYHSQKFRIKNQHDSEILKLNQQINELNNIINDTKATKFTQ